MATWVNPFDAGPCLVQAWWDSSSGSPTVSQSMLPNDQMLVFSGDGVDYFVEVTVDAEVRLASTVPTTGGSHNAVVLVSSGPDASLARISGLTLRDPVIEAYAITSITPQTSDIELSPGPPVSPDPAAWASGTDVSTIGMFAQWGGGDTTIFQFTPEIEQESFQDTLNCDCDAGTEGNRTLADLRATLMDRLGFADPLGSIQQRTLSDLRKDLMARLGFAAQVNNPPPGMTVLLDSFINQAQQILWRRLELDKGGLPLPAIMSADTDQTTLDATMVFALAMAEGKAHYGRSDAELYTQETEKMLSDYVARHPPNIVRTLNAILDDAQKQLYRRYDILRTERFYSWSLQTGVKFYDIDSNDEACAHRLDPRKITWAGVVRDDTWTALTCGIPPEVYSGDSQGWPERYEIRQCIEVWPVPDDDEGKLVIKGHFGLDRFTEDGDKTTIDDQLVLLMALANASKEPDASKYVAQLEVFIQTLVAGTHQTRSYIPGSPDHCDMVYTKPKPTEPFPS